MKFNSDRIGEVFLVVFGVSVGCCFIAATFAVTAKFIYWLATS